MCSMMFVLAMLDHAHINYDHLFLLHHVEAFHVILALTYHFFICFYAQIACTKMG